MFLDSDMAPYGWRARIGYISPAPRHETHAYEFYQMAPEGVMAVMTSLTDEQRPGGTYHIPVEAFDSTVKQLVDRHVDAIVQSGVPPAAVHGWGFDDELLAHVAQVTDIPMVTDLGSCTEAMRTLEMSRVVMLTPFDAEMNELLSVYVKHAGVDVVAHSVLGDVEPNTMRTQAIAAVAPSQVYGDARSVFRSTPGAEGVWITGALMPSVAVIDPLEQDLAAPVISSAQAMMWAGLRRAGVGAAVAGFGRLFDHR